MKVERILAKCPKCGHKDKRIRRSTLDDNQAPGEISGLICDNCGHIFENHRI
jgi:Cys-rich peptide (TIGR04165 family)